MSLIDEEIEVEAPLRATYDQWTQFEDFPRFMAGIEAVRQLDDTTLHWVASIAGVRREWDARITQQIPDQLIAWMSLDGSRHDGLVTFDAVGAHRTRVTLRLDLEPEGALESIGDALGVIGASARGDLARFKAFIESRLLPTGAWRGEVLEGDVVAGAAPRPAGGPVGEVDASTGGVVDLDRLVGHIPVLLVFLEPLASPSSEAVIASVGERLVEFGRERVQVLAVARVDAETASAAADGIAGNLRVLADPDEQLARRLGADYRSDQPVIVLLGADGRRAAAWVGAPGPDFAEGLRARLSHLSAR